MSRQMVDILRKIYCRVELSGSVLNSVDACLQYGEISREEHEYAHKVIGVWLLNQTVQTLENPTKKRLAFKALVEGYAQ